MIPFRGFVGKRFPHFEYLTVEQHNPNLILLFFLLRPVQTPKLFQFQLGSQIYISLGYSRTASAGDAMRRYRESEEG